MSTHYTPSKASLVHIIRWRRLFFEILAPLFFVLASVNAWLDGRDYTTYLVLATWIYILIIIGVRVAPFRALQVHAVGGAFLFIIQGMYAVVTNTDAANRFPTMIAGVVFAMLALLAEAYHRIRRLEAPTSRTRAADFPGIYRITCLPNGKQYIGQTSQAINARWSEHRMMMQSQRHHNRWMQADWNLYRPEQFKWEVLEVVTDPVWLLDRERAWQDKDYDANKRYNPPNIAPRIAKANRRPPMKRKARP